MEFGKNYVRIVVWADEDTDFSTDWFRVTTPDGIKEATDVLLNLIRMGFQTIEIVQVDTLY